MAAKNIINLISDNMYLVGFPDGSADKNQPTIQETQETWFPFLGWRDPLEKENGNPLQGYRLENPMDGRAWQATVHVVIKSQT